MSALAVTPAGVPGQDCDRERVVSAWPEATDLGGEPTLDMVMAGVWEGLAAHRSAACPMCGGEMTPDYGAHALPVGGRCRSCGTMLS
ncbi:MAG: hypothetical protein WAL63_20965 [Solirubrobacteraceae bacterium]